MRKLVITILIILVALAIWMIIKTDKISYDSENPPVETGGASGQFAKLSEEAIVVQDQRPGDVVVVGTASLKVDGFVIIKRDAGGKAGEIIGVSEFLTKGVYEKTEVGTTESLMDGINYYAETYSDDGNGIFDPKNDKSVVETQFTVDKDAKDPRTIQIYY